MSGYDRHDFYCMKCGKKGIPVQRKINHKHGKHHRKKLWCMYCKQEVNHIECRNDQEVQEFLENFAAGMYKEEVEESLNYIQKENEVWS